MANPWELTQEEMDGLVYAEYAPRRKELCRAAQKKLLKWGLSPCLEHRTPTYADLSKVVTHFECPVCQKRLLKEFGLED